MPLVLEPEKLPRAVLEAVHREMRESVAETLELVRHPRGAVRQPASLVTAEELLTASIAQMDRPGARDASALASETNFAYAAMLAAIDLVKSHTDVPTVPQPRPKPSV